ncbi:hypothetical protein, partial [Amedibacillus sp. YH-ame10]
FFYDFHNILKGLLPFSLNLNCNNSLFLLFLLLTAFILIIYVIENNRVLNGKIEKKQKKEVLCISFSINI